MPGYARHTPTLTGNKAVRIIRCDTALLPHVGDVLGNLSLPYQWVEIGDTVEDTVAAALEIALTYYDGAMIGTVSQFVKEPPAGWLTFNGATRNKADYPELFDVLPAAWKGSTTFTLPSVTEYFLRYSAAAADVGNTGGTNTINLTVNQLPSHTHTYTNPIANVDLEAPGAPDILAAGVGPGANTGATGSGDDIDNQPQFLVLVLAVFAGR